MSDPLDTVIEDAAKRLARNEATDADKILLVMNRQCKVHEENREMLREVLAIARMLVLDRKRLFAIVGAVMGSGAVGGGIVAAVLGGLFGAG